MMTQAINLQKFASINATAERESLSSKYSFIPTTQVINAFESKGWLPVKASEVRAKDDRKGFQKHLIRFRHENSVPMLNGIHPEIVLTNSHDGLASFKVMAGLFRLVCANGLVVADSTFGSVSIRHMGYTDKAVHEAIENISDTVPMITGKVKDFQAIDLTPDEMGIYAMSALAIKYPELENRDFNIPRLLAPVRSQDRNPSLWNTYNTVQEKFLKGGRYEMKTPYPERHPDYKVIGKARKVNSISEDIRINKGLWMLTEKMAELKGMTIH